jgi:hypothetical protein
MKQSSAIELISASILAASIVFVPMTLPASAQVTTPRTDTQNTTTTTYEDRTDDRGLWGLSGLAGLLGLLGRRKDSRSDTRNDTPVYRDPSIR